MKVNANAKDVKKALSRRVKDIYPSKKELEKALMSGRRLVIYHGVDPTAPDLHLGHSTNYLLLSGLQKLGHKIILLIGDFTAQIGDPTGKDKARKSLTKKEILLNCKSYKKQIGKILDLKSKNNPASVKFNSKWLEKLTLKEVIALMSKITSQRMLERDMFQKRIKDKRPIWLHELLYPLLQGYDSVAMNVDVEVGGNDQTFNMLVGRTLMKEYRRKEKFIITTSLLENPKTGRKLMSKSEGKYISLNDSPRQMYGKTMALPDEVIVPCLSMCTKASKERIFLLKNKLKNKRINPRDAKAFLAKELVSLYYGDKEAIGAEKEFKRVFKDKKRPASIKKVSIPKKEIGILDLLLEAKFSSSKSEAKRLVLQGGVKINNKIKKDWKESVQIKKGDIVQVGKKRFIEIK